MDGKRITKRLVDSLSAGSTEFFVWDSKLPGFGLRVQPSGAMSYVVKYRAGSGRAAPTRRVTLGRVGKITPNEAENLAKRVLGAVAHGADPAAAKSADRRAATLNELAALFLSDHVAAKRKRATADHYKHILEKLVLPALGNRKADQVTAADIAGCTPACGSGRIWQIASSRWWVASTVSRAGAGCFPLASIPHVVSTNIPKRDVSGFYPQQNWPGLATQFARRKPKAFRGKWM